MKPRSTSAVISRWIPDFDLVERFLHLVEERWDPTCAHALVDEQQQVLLLLGSACTLLAFTCAHQQACTNE